MRIKKRLGKDLNILWKVTFKDGSSFTAAMKDDLILEARDSLNKLYILPIVSIDSAGVHAKFDGDDHGICGAYTLTLWYLRGKEGTTCVDLPSAFELVRYTDYESSNNIADMDGDIIVTAMEIEYGKTELSELAAEVNSVKTTANNNTSKIGNLTQLSTNNKTTLVEAVNEIKETTVKIGSETTESDLDIADESGNVLARFKDGNFKTKNFDSEKVGYVTNLNTDDKSSIVNAINETNLRINEVEEEVATLRDEFDEGFTVLQGKVGNLENLDTNTKNDLVEAVNEINEAVTDLEQNLGNKANQTDLTALANDVSQITPTVDKDGFHIADQNGNVGLTLNENGLDVAKLSTHIITLIKAIEGLGLALGETNTTAYTGSKGKANADAITSLQSSVTSITSIVGDLISKLCEISGNAFSIVDSDLNIGMTYGNDGFDVAKVTEHFISVLRAAGVATGSAIDDVACNVEETGFFFVDENLKVGVKVDGEGVHAKNILEYEIIED